MPQELTPRVIESTDSDVWDPVTQKLRRITTVTYRLGDLGPFREEFDRETFSEAALRERMDKKRATLRPFT